MNLSRRSFLRRAIAAPLVAAAAPVLAQTAVRVAASSWGFEQVTLREANILIGNPAQSCVLTGISADNWT